MKNVLNNPAGPRSVTLCDKVNRWFGGLLEVGMGKAGGNPMTLKFEV